MQAATSFYGTSYQQPPTTACVLWLMSACCATCQTPSQSNSSDKQHVPESKELGCWDQPADEVPRCLVLYSSFFCRFFWKQTGKMESTARMPSTAREFQETASPAVVSLYSCVPALMATKDGGATPRKVPIKKTPKGKLMTGEVMLMNQLGRNGVILRKMM